MQAGLAMLYDATPIIQQALEGLVGDLAAAQTAGGGLREDQLVRADLAVVECVV